MTASARAPLVIFIGPVYPDPPTPLTRSAYPRVLRAVTKVTTWSAFVLSDGLANRLVEHGDGLG